VHFPVAKLHVGTFVLSHGKDYYSSLGENKAQIGSEIPLTIRTMFPC